MKMVVSLLLAMFALGAHAESTYGTTAATANVKLTIVVPAVFAIKETRQNADGTLTLIVFTNVPSYTVGGETFNFPRPGTYSITLMNVSNNRLEYSTTL